VFLDKPAARVGECVGEVSRDGAAELKTVGFLVFLMAEVEVLMSES